MQVSNISSIGSSLPAQPSTAPTKPKSNFTQMVGDLVQEANNTQLEADSSVRELMAGNVDNVHDVVLNVAKADLSFRFLLEVRNKVTEAYQEISRMPL